MQTDRLLPENETGHPGLPHGLRELIGPYDSSLHTLKSLVVDGGVPSQLR